MTTYVFIAGAWHGSWCWSEIAPRLESAGHRVLTPNLRGMSAGECVVTQDTLRIWADQIAELMAEQDAPVTLVGHSRGGIIISEVAERVPEKVDMLVYLCAFLLKDGQTLGELANQAENAQVFGASIAFDERGTCTVDNNAVRPFFYNNTPEPLVRIAREKLVPEPVASLYTPIHVTEARFGSVSRSYIECLDDQAIPIATQRLMQSAFPLCTIISLDSDHSPFFSQPEALVEALHSIRTTQRFA